MDMRSMSMSILNPPLDASVNPGTRDEMGKGWTTNRPKGKVDIGTRKGEIRSISEGKESGKSLDFWCPLVLGLGLTTAQRIHCLKKVLFGSRLIW